MATGLINLTLRECGQKKEEKRLEGYEVPLDTSSTQV